MWLDGFDPAGNGVRPATGASVSTWVDKSRKGNSPTSSSGVYPTYNATSNALVWTGGDARLTFPATISNSVVGRSFTVFFVSRRTVATSDMFIVRGTNTAANSNLLIGHSTTTAWRFAFYANDLDATIPAYSAGESATVSCFIYSKPGRAIHHNGSIAATASNANATDLASWTGAMIGGNYVWAAYNGVVYEMLLYDRSLAIEDRQQVEGYLAWKYGIQTVLPATHPYRGNVRPYTRPFQPLDILGCGLWLDAADATTMTLSGSNVTTWADKSGNGNNATGGGTTLPTFSNNSIVLNGSGSFTTAYTAIPPAETFFIVYKWNTLTTSTFISGNSGVRNRIFYTEPSASRWLYLGSIATWGVWNTTALTSNVVYLVEYIWNGSAVVLATNGLNIPNNGSAGGISAFANAGTSSIGGGMNGVIYEIIAYSSALTTTQRERVEGYLAHKWGLVANIPSYQPFKLITPLSPTFTPLQIPGCALWLDAADRSTLTLSGSNVTQWNDKSGNGFNATIPVVAGIVNPVHAVGAQNGNSILQFRSGSDGMVVLGNNFLSATAPSLCYILAIRLSATQPGNFYQGIISTDRPGFYGRGLGISGTVFQELYHNGFLNTAVTWSSSWAIIELHFNGTSSATLYLNGTATTVTTSAASTNNNEGLKIGCYNYTGSGIAAFNANFDVGEIIVLTTVPTTLQRQQIEGHLAGKWGTTAALPSTHPFKRIMP